MVTKKFVDNLYNKRITDIMIGNLKLRPDVVDAVFISANEVIIMFTDVALYVFIDNGKVFTKTLTEDEYEILIKKMM